MKEIIYWISIVLMWVACGLNICGTVRNVRLSRKLDKFAVWYEESIQEFRAAKQAYEDMLAELRKEATNEGDH